MLTTTNGVFDLGIPQRARLLDLNGDGVLDLASGGTTYFLGDGTGGVGAPVPTFDGRRLLDVGDVDGDGDLVQLTGPAGSSFGLAVVLNDAVGSPGSQALFGNNSLAPRFLELDGDGDLDIVAPEFDTLELFENQVGGVRVIT